MLGWSLKWERTFRSLRNPILKTAEVGSSKLFTSPYTCAPVHLKSIGLYASLEEEEEKDAAKRCNSFCLLDGADEVAIHDWEMDSPLRA